MHYRFNPADAMITEMENCGVIGGGEERAQTLLAVGPVGARHLLQSKGAYHANFSSTANQKALMLDSGDNLKLATVRLPDKFARASVYSPETYR